MKSLIEHPHYSQISPTPRFCAIDPLTPPGNILSLFCASNFTFSRMAYVRNHKMPSLLRLASFTWYIAFEIQWYCCMNQRLIPFYCGIVFYYVCLLLFKTQPNSHFLLEVFSDSRVCVVFAFPCLPDLPSHTSGRALTTSLCIPTRLNSRKGGHVL